MAQILVLYGTPVDPSAFDRYYHATHIPIAAKIPGVRERTISAGPVQSLAGGTPPYLVATLEFDSIADLNAGLVSAEGQAAAADVANFATGGATLLVFDKKVL